MPPKPKYGNFGIMQYKNGDYKTINKYLRKVRFEKREFLQSGDDMDDVTRERMEKIIADIDSQMRHDVSTIAPVLYRGTSPDEFGLKNTNDLLKLIGTTRRWKSYTSTSDLKRLAEKYANKSANGILLEITPSSNVSYVDLRTYRDLKYTKTEPEILLARDTTYRVTNILGTKQTKKPYVCVKIQLVRTRTDLP